MTLRVFAIAFAGGIVALVAFTGWALEWSGVAVANTTTKDGVAQSICRRIGRITHLLVNCAEADAATQRIGNGC